MLLEAYATHTLRQGLSEKYAFRRIYKEKLIYKKEWLGLGVGNCSLLDH